MVQEIDSAFDRVLDPEGGGATSHADTAWFGGGGAGNGAIVRGGIWNWEASSGEAPEFFPDGDPVGNQYRDGWRFTDLTAANGPRPLGTGHWRFDGTYDFNLDRGGFAHRATTHANNGVNDGPNPLDDPANGTGNSAWSLWIGTNQFLNPEHCGWTRTAGYGNSWSQGIARHYPFRNAPGPEDFPTPPTGAALSLRFFHRYALESGFDSLLVEISLDGIHWAGPGGTAVGFTGGTRQNPLPAPGGGAEVVNLLNWPGGEGDLHVRFRLKSDTFFSDEDDGGDFLFGAQLDDIALRVNGSPIDNTNFETSTGRWAIGGFEGDDIFLTDDPLHPAGRIDALSQIACGIPTGCPESCGIENRVLLFTDRDECLPNPVGAETGIVSRAFAIGGAAYPDLDGDGGRLVEFDLYHPGGPDMFETTFMVCSAYSPAGTARCPYTPPGGAPGAGQTFDWSRTGTQNCDFFAAGTSAICFTNLTHDISDTIPAGADSVVLVLGALGDADFYYDNIRFGVYDPQSPQVQSSTIDRYSDNFPTANGNLVTQTARTDNAYSQSCGFGGCNPLRWVRGDSSAVSCGGDNTALYLRFRVTPGPCQPNLGHPYFAAFPPGQWHSARMDTARATGSGGNVPGTYMTCFHEQDPRNGTFWTGVPPAVEPCDDILPDGLFSPGTVVKYFYEARDAGGGVVAGTFPRRANGAPIGTTENFASLWLETTVLPALTPACNGTYAHNLLVVNDYATNAVPGMGTVLRERLTSTLASLGLDFDVYDVVGTNFTEVYDGIGRREDRITQQPRPPTNGATQQQLEPYDCIWYTAGLSKDRTLSDTRTVSFFGGQPSKDQQSLQTWLSGCTAGNNRLLVLEGQGWASDIDVNTTNGPSFLTNRGVDVLADDYAQDLAANDQRRCARISGTALAPDITGEVFASGCPDNYELDVLHAVSGGEALAFFVESLEDGNDPVQCADDVPRPDWQAVVRRATGVGNCQRSVSMSFAFADFLPLNCVEQCLFDDFVINGPNAELVIDLFQWAGKPVNPSVIGVGAGGAPAITAGLQAPRPNPAKRGPAIRYAISARGRVRLKIYDVGGRLVRTLVDDVQEPSASGFEVVWDGTNDAGARAGSGVYFYELDSPGFVATQKLVLLE
jgi:hypothetical protein